MSLSTNGGLNINSLSGIGERILLTDASGNLVALSSTNITGFFASNNLGVLQKTGNNYYLPSGNLGIGIQPSPGIKLDVIGDARISNNLYVGGGIVITDKVSAATQIKGFDFKVDNDLTVDGNSVFSGNLTAAKGITFDAANNIGISYTPPTVGNTVGSFIFGKGGPNLPIATCLNVNAAPFQFNGFMQSLSGNSISNVNAALTIGSAPWDGSGIIEVEGSNVQNVVNGVPTNGLLVNYFCGRNIYLGVGAGTGSNTSVQGAAGSRLYTGDFVNMRTTLKIGNSGNDNFDSNTAVDLYNNGNAGWNGIKFTTPWNSAKLISVSNTNFATSPFTVFGDGRTQINTNATDAFIVNNSTTGEINFKVKNTGFVYAREINVQTTTFPDYVFDNSYKPLTILELDNYININNHLPGFKKAEDYVKEGINVSEVLVKQQEKIEELALYIIELKKEVEVLKKK